MGNPLDELQEFAESPFGTFVLGPQNALGLTSTPDPVLQAGAIAAAAAVGGPIAAAGIAIALGRILREDPRFPQDHGLQQQNIRDAAAPWRWVYGEARVGGTYTFLGR